MCAKLHLLFLDCGVFYELVVFTRFFIEAPTKSTSDRSYIIFLESQVNYLEVIQLAIGLASQASFAYFAFSPLMGDPP